MNLTILYWVLLGVMLLGVIGTLAPAIPGASLILVAILVWGMATGFAGLGVPLVVIFVVLIISAGIEFAATYWGARQMGASKWGQIGAIVGMVLGLFGFLPALPIGGPLLGLLIGPIVGAFLGEFLYRRDVAFQERFQLSLKASLGIIIGSLLGNVIEMVLAIVAVAIFVWTTWPVVSALS